MTLGSAFNVNVDANTSVGDLLQNTPEARSYLGRGVRAEWKAVAKQTEKTLTELMALEALLATLPAAAQPIPVVAPAVPREPPPIPLPPAGRAEPAPRPQPKRVRRAAALALTDLPLVSVQRENPGTNDRGATIYQLDYAGFWASPLGLAVWEGLSQFNSHPAIILSRVIFHWCYVLLIFWLPLLTLAGVLFSLGLIVVALISNYKLMAHIIKGCVMFVPNYMMSLAEAFAIEMLGNVAANLGLGTPRQPPGPTPVFQTGGGETNYPANPPLPPPWPWGATLVSLLGLTWAARH